MATSLQREESLLWMDKSCATFGPMGNYSTLVFTGESSFQGFLGAGSIDSLFATVGLWAPLSDMRQTRPVLLGRVQ